MRVIIALLACATLVGEERQPLIEYFSGVGFGTEVHDIVLYSDGTVRYKGDRCRDIVELEVSGWWSLAQATNRIDFTKVKREHDFGIDAPQMTLVVHPVEDVNQLEKKVAIDFNHMSDVPVALLLLADGLEWLVLKEIERGRRERSLVPVGPKQKPQEPPPTEEQVQARVLELLKDLKAKDEAWKRRFAAERIGEYGPAAAVAVPELLRCLEAEDVELVKQALRSLGGIGPAVAPAIQTIAVLDGHDDPDVRHAVLRTLAAIAPEDGKVRNFFRERLLDKDSTVRFLSAKGLGPKDANAVSTLVDLLERGAGPGLWTTMELLASWDKAAEPAIPVLKKLLSHGDPFVEGRAVHTLHALDAMTDEEAVESLREDRRGAKDGVRERQIWWLVKMGVPGRDAIAELLDDANAFTRGQAAHALGRFGPLAAPAVPRLVELLGDEDEYVRKGAAEALMHILPGLGIDWDQAAPEKPAP